MATSEDAGIWGLRRDVVHSIFFSIVSIFHRKTTSQCCICSGFKTIKTVKHFEKCHLNIQSLLNVGGITVAIPTGLWHTGSSSSSGSDWPPPPILGWTALVAGCRGAPSRKQGAGLLSLLPLSLLPAGPPGLPGLQPHLFGG